jgi:hypothetical protein
MGGGRSNARYPTLVSGISGAPRLELLKKHRLGGLLEKLILEPLKKPCQRGSSLTEKRFKRSRH